MMDDAAKKQGLDNFTCPSDVLMLLERAVTDTGLGPESARRFVDILKRQQCNNKFPAWLPPGTVLAHKTGDLPGTEHDAGILYVPAGPVVAVLLTKDLKNNSDGIQLANRIGKCIFDRFS
jgi:beta-lactamase class A